MANLTLVQIAYAHALAEMIEDLYTALDNLDPQADLITIMIDDGCRIDTDTPEVVLKQDIIRKAIVEQIAQYEEQLNDTYGIKFVRENWAVED